MRKQFRTEDVIRDGKPKPCSECKSFKNCKYLKFARLCPPVEAWVNQDWVGKPANELLQNAPFIPTGDTNDFVDHMSYHQADNVVKRDPKVAEKAWEELLSLNIRESLLEFADLYYRQGKSLTEIAKILKISAQAADSRHNYLKQAVRNRLKHKELWKEIQEKILYNRNKLHNLILCLFFNEGIPRNQIADMSGLSETQVGVIVNKYL